MSMDIQQNTVFHVGDETSQSTEMMVFEENTCGLSTTVRFNFRETKSINTREKWTFVLSACVGIVICIL